jgi:hypothetical protein
MKTAANRTTKHVPETRACTVASLRTGIFMAAVGDCGDER